MKKSLRKALLIVLSLCMLIVVVPISTVSASTKDNYLSSFSISKKTIYKGNAVNISLKSAKKDSSGLVITFVIKNSSKKNYSISAHEYAINTESNKHLPHGWCFSYSQKTPTTNCCSR